MHIVCNYMISILIAILSYDTDTQLIRIVLPTEFKSATTNEFKSNRVYLKTYHMASFPSQYIYRPCLIKNPGAQKNALLDSHIYPEGSNFIRPPIILSGARNKTVVAVGFSEDRTNTCS